MIGIQYAGGLGNQMFQHAFARILQARHRVALGSWRAVSPAIKAFPATSRGLVEKEFQDPVTVLPGRNSLERIDPQREEDMDPSSLGTLLTARDVVLHGYFQKYHYYQEHGDFLRDLYRMEAPEIAQRPGDEDLVVYLQSYFNVGVDFFLREIPKVPHRHLWIMVNDLERGWEMVGKIRRRFGGQILHHSSHLKDFYFLQLASRMILAPSTFAWWAAYLSHAREIVFARPTCGYGSRSHGVASLEVSNDPRYRYVDYWV